MDEKVMMTFSFDPTPELRDALGLRDREYVGFETLYTKPTVDEALAAGNRRAERMCHDTGARKVFFVCSECGEAYRKDSMRLWHHKPWSYCPNCGARIVEEGDE